MKRFILLTSFVAGLGFPAAEASGQTLPQWYLDTGMPATDTDGDGIPDAWESRTFGDPAAADSGLDRDGDGLTGLEEFAFGSDPRTPGTMGDGWSDREKRDAGLDAGFRVTPAVTFAQWLEWLEWDAEDWLTQTATNAEGFAVSYGGFVCNNAPYSDTNLNATVDFWLVTRTDRPAWLTVGDALTTNAFSVRAGTGRYRIRAAYGGPVALTLDPHPGALAQTPGATNGPWLCDMRVEPDRANTVVFSDGETPAPVPGGPDSVDGLLLLAPPPAFPAHSLSSPPPRAVLQPLRMTAGTVVLGNGGWYCLCASLPPCDWPDYSMIGCDAVSMSMNGVTGDTPLMTKDEAHDIYWERFPCVECTVTQTVANALYPFLYGKVIFSFRQCEAVGGVSGAEEHPPWHEPGYSDHSPCGGIGCACDGGPHWTVGFDHWPVNTRNLTRIETGNQDEDTTEHCVGVIWSANGKLNLFSLLDDSYLPFTDELHFTSDNLTVSPNGELMFPKSKPDDLKPAISLVKLHYAPNPETDLIFDKLWVVVNSPETKTSFDGWYAQNADISWTTNLPSPFANITINISNGITNVVDPEPNWPGFGVWAAPEPKHTYLHHDAQYEMRSNPVAGGHGHQTMYDALGQLITNPIAAGTADMHAPYDSMGLPLSARSHRNHDVYPFIRALQLDGNPVQPTNKSVPTNLTRPCIYKGPNTDKYIGRRPVLPTGKQ